MSIKLRLSILNFLEYAVWGAYLTSMGSWLASIGLGDKIGWFYAMQGFVSIFIPPLMGMVADRWIPAQRLLGICHALAAAFLALAGYVGMQSGSSVDFATLFSLYSLSMAFYMPTIALSNSVAYSILLKNGEDTVTAFPPIRTIGTIGFILAMLFVDFTGFQNTYAQFFTSAALGILMFFYTFTLPTVPISSSPDKASLSKAFNIEAFSLFRNSRMAIFFIFSMLLGVSLQITNGYANPFITSFKEIPEFADTWGANHANALISLSQISETLCILLIPFFLKRFGIKIVMLIAMFAWFLRFALFAAGDPGPGLPFFILSMLVYGVAFDFFNVSGSLYVDRETPANLRSGAQGIFMMMTNGFGATLGMLGAQLVVNHFVYSQETPADQLGGWRISWMIFASYAFAVGLLFLLVFKDKPKVS